MSAYPLTPRPPAARTLGQRHACGALALRAAASLLLSRPPAGATVVLSVNTAPPALPVYEQPPLPAPGYIWTPGYWSYGEAGYFWVPGVWVQPPSAGLLW